MRFSLTCRLCISVKRVRMEHLVHGEVRTDGQEQELGNWAQVFSLTHTHTCMQPRIWAQKEKHSFCRAVHSWANSGSLLKAWQPKERIKRSRRLGETASTECQVQHGPEKEGLSLFLFLSLSKWQSRRPTTCLNICVERENKIKKLSTRTQI